MLTFPHAGDIIKLIIKGEFMRRGDKIIMFMLIAIAALVISIGISTAVMKNKNNHAHAEHSAVTRLY